MLRETVHPSRLKTILLKEHHSIKCAHPPTAQRVSGFFIGFISVPPAVTSWGKFLSELCNIVPCHPHGQPKLSLSIPFLFGLECGEQCKAALRAGEEAL